MVVAPRNGENTPLLAPLNATTKKWPAFTIPILYT